MSIEHDHISQLIAQLVKLEECSRNLRQAAQEYQRKADFKLHRAMDAEINDVNKIAGELVEILSTMVSFSGDASRPSRLPLAQAKIAELETAMKNLHP